MKAKLNFDKEKVTQFFLNHSEKIVFGISSVVLALLCYTAITRETYNLDPTKLAETINDVDRSVEAETWKEEDNDLKVNSYRTLTSLRSKEVDHGPFELDVQWNPPVEEFRRLRGEPKYLAARELVADTGFGAIAIGGGSSNGGFNDGDMGGDMGGGGMGGAGAGGMGGAGMGGAGAGGMGGAGAGGMGGAGAGGMGAGAGGMGGAGASGMGGGGMGGAGAGGMGGGGMGGAGAGGMGGGGMGGAGAGGMGAGAGGMGGAGAGGMGGAGAGGMGGAGAGGMGGMGGGGMGGAKGKGKNQPATKGKGSLANMPTSDEEDELVVDGDKPVYATVPAGTKLEGRRWVVVRGIVPYAEQLADYVNIFQNTYESENGAAEPEYLGFEVERAEVSSGDNTSEPNWEKLENLNEALEESLRWGKYPEPIQQKYLIDALTESLPPMVFKNHDETVGHPKIPFATAKEVATDKAKSVKSDKKDAGFANVLGKGRKSKASGRGTGKQGAAGKGQLGRGSNGAKSLDAPVERADVALFRFFDFNVEPGKTYRYRIRVVLRNPNFEVPLQYLDKTNAAQLAEGEFRMTEWSPPTSAITVPKSTDLLAGKVNPARGNNDPRVLMMLRTFDSEKAANVICRRWLERGSFANIKAPKESSKSKKPSAKSDEDIPSQDFATDMLVVDIAGGNPLTGASDLKALADLRLKDPDEVLVFNIDGGLTSRSRVGDANNYRREEKAADPAKTESMLKGMEGNQGTSVFDMGGAPKGSKSGKSRKNKK